MASWKRLRKVTAQPVNLLRTCAFAGEMSSDDDFYMLDSGLVVLQTTNDILNASLYELLDHRTVVSWQRVRNMSTTQVSALADMSALKSELAGTVILPYIHARR